MIVSSCEQEPACDPSHAPTSGGIHGSKFCCSFKLITNAKPMHVFNLNILILSGLVRAVFKTPLINVPRLFTCFWNAMISRSVNQVLIRHKVSIFSEFQPENPLKMAKILSNCNTKTHVTAIKPQNQLFYFYHLNTVIELFQ